jgi:acetyltransferase-like isoleucine patch superfamily enzyme
VFDVRFIRFLAQRAKGRMQEAHQQYDLLRRNPTLRIEDDVQIRSPERLSVGTKVLIQKGTIIDCGGMEWCDYRGSVVLGDGCAIGPHCILFGAGEIVLEKDSGLALGAMLISQEGTFLEEGETSKTENLKLRFEKIVIREGSWVTSGAIVLAGSDIGRRSIIAPGAVVKGQVPANSLVVGNPARILPRGAVSRNRAGAP